MAKAAHPDANIIFGAVIDDSLGDEVRITVIAAGFDRYDGEKRPSRGLTSLGLDDDDDLGDGIDFGSQRRATTATATTSSTSPSSCADRRRHSLIETALIEFTGRASGSSSPTATAGCRRALRHRQPRRPRRRRSRRGRREPRARLAAARLRTVPMTRAAWVWLRQVHGAASSTVDAPPRPTRSGADAAVTTALGLPLVVLTADCAPVALVAPGAVGRGPRGWPGLEQGVIGAAVDALRARRPGSGHGRCSGRACTRRATSSAPTSSPGWSTASARRSPSTHRRRCAPRSTSPPRCACRARARRRRATSPTSTCAPRRRPTTSPTGATA